MLHERDTPLTNINDCESISFFLKQFFSFFSDKSSRRKQAVLSINLYFFPPKIFFD